MLAAQLINGLVIGSTYALVAVGMTLVLGVLDRLNFAHTDVFAAGGFAAVGAAAGGDSVWWGLPVALAAGAALGLLVERISFRQRRSADARVTGALSSLAAGLVLVDLIRKVWGSDPVGLPSPTGFAASGLEVAGTRVLGLHLLIVALALLLAAGLHAVVQHTLLGKRIRAVAESPERAALLGIDPVRIAQTVFAASSALAAAAGFLVALRIGSASPDVGLGFGLKAIAIMAIGGLGDMRGALLAGLLVGLLEAAMFQLGLGRLGEIAVWVLMILCLLVRPAGLFARGPQAGEARA